MKELLNQYKYMAATTNVWSRSNLSFIAATAHCVDEKTLETKSFFIACEYFPGRHNKHTVSKKLHSIFSRYEILEKVYFITTDAAGENVAAINVYGDQFRSIIALRDDINIDDDVENENDEESLDDDDFELHWSDLNQAEISANSDFVVMDPFEDSNENEPIPMLPKLNRIGCSSHMLDKVNII